MKISETHGKLKKIFSDFFIVNIGKHKNIQSLQFEEAFFVGQ